jgi:site-specific DNA-cytosine methylase
MQLIPTAFHLTQDPISGTVTPAMSADNRLGCATIGVHTELGVRRLTPTECERLQGFPDDWTSTSEGQSQYDSARYRQLGNAVAVPVVEWIARRLAQAA